MHLQRFDLVVMIYGIIISIVGKKYYIKQKIENILFIENEDQKQNMQGHIEIVLLEVQIFG
jgi:hypothetical protein